VYSNAGSLNSEEEQELEVYFKEIEEENKGRGEALTSIPKASPRMSNARWGECHASESDVDVALKAERMKALRNEGNPGSNPTIVPFNSASFIPNLEKLGIVVGLDENSRDEALLVLNRVVQAGSGVNNLCDKKEEVLELEEKELDEEEEVDKLLLQNICGELMEEVMDVGGEDFVIPTKHSTRKWSCKKWGMVAKRKGKK
jgi:hypothetical protein